MSFVSISLSKDIVKQLIWDNEASSRSDASTMPRGGKRLRTAEGTMNLVGPRVVGRRSQLQMRQDELCARIARATDGAWIPSWQDVSRIEHGTRLVTDLEVIALADSLECSPCWLLIGDDSATC